MKKKKTTKVLLLIIPFLVIALLFLGTYLYFEQSSFTQEITTRKISDKQISFKEDLTRERETTDEYTEIRGYSEQLINKKYPNIILSNLENNTVYIQYEVTLNGRSIYKTDLIEPGMMELFNIYNQLDSGSYTLVYNITTYDTNNMKETMSGIHLEQKIIIQKE